MAVADRGVVWEHIRRRYGDNGGSLGVTELQSSLKMEKYDYGRESLNELFKEYEQLGLGRFTLGRHGRRTRISWVKAPKELKYEPRSAGLGRLDGPVRMLEYPLPLRPGITAKLVLPEDLTNEESARVVELVRLATAAA